MREIAKKLMTLVSLNYSNFFSANQSLIYYYVLTSASTEIIVNIYSIYIWICVIN